MYFIDEMTTRKLNIHKWKEGLSKVTQATHYIWKYKIANSETKRQIKNFSEIEHVSYTLSIVSYTCTYDVD